MWKNIHGPVIADTMYEDKKLIAKDVTFTLPGLEFLTVDVNAMGNMTVPLIGLLKNMELSITKAGVDINLAKINKLEPHKFEFRWVQDVVHSDGTVKPEGCKAFVRVLPLTTPELGVELGNATEAESTYTVTRQQIYCDGKEYLCVDRLSGVLRVNGKDYYKSISKLL